MNIFMTGATGFLGSHLLRKLLALNHKVYALKRKTSNYSRIQDLLSDKNLLLVDGDDFCLEDVFSTRSIDVILHVATEYGRNSEPVHDILNTNLILPIKLIELGIKGEVKTFVNTDSYFNKENFNYSTLLNYSLSKRSLIVWLKQFSKQINIVNMVLEHIYGPYDSESKFVEHLIRSIAVDRIERVPLTHGHQKRDFVYVDDVADAYVFVLDRIKQQHVTSFLNFEVGTGESVQIRDFAETIKNLAKSPTILGFGDVPYRSDEIMDSKANISGLKELGWIPATKIDQGITKILGLYGVSTR